MLILQFVLMASQNSFVMIFGFPVVKQSVCCKLSYAITLGCILTPYATSPPLCSLPRPTFPSCTFLENVLASEHFAVYVSWFSK